MRKGFCFVMGLVSFTPRRRKRNTHWILSEIFHHLSVFFQLFLIDRFVIFVDILSNGRIGGSHGDSSIHHSSLWYGNGRVCDDDG
eukprot:scaffold40691_cov191-Amphora_coffeaeformis.AAC.2